MSRNVQFQHLRGTYANLLALQSGTDPDTGALVLPLQTGELYFAIDTRTVFMGTPGTGLGYIQIGDTTKVNETMQACLTELKAMRLALTCLACEGGKNKPTDFDPESVVSQQEFASQTE